MKTDIKTVWDFVEQYYPNYTSSDEIAENEDLHKIINGQIDGEAENIYNETKESIDFMYGENLDESELESEVLKEIENQKNASDTSIFEEAIKAYIETLNVPQTEEKTYYLFGEDVVRALNDDGIDEAIELIEENESYSIFIFIEGVTKSHELAEAMQGWNDYAIISEQEYNQILNS